MPTCTFCKKGYEWPKGLTLILNDGKIQSFCSSKCQKNLRLKRDSKKVNWVKREKKVKTLEGKVKAVEKSTEKVSEKKEAKAEKKE